MTDLIPAQLIGFSKSVDSTRSFFRGFNPVSGQGLNPVFFEASIEEIGEACELAASCFRSYRNITGAKRAAFLSSIAEKLEGSMEKLVEVCGAETALPEARLRGELARTTFQLRSFAHYVGDDSWVKCIDEKPDATRTPQPRPSLVQLQVPIGPVAVFGASNFPFAFSAAGGDTAAALAAGCPVVFKAHPAHPSTCQLVAQCILEAAMENDMPAGVFSMVHGASNQVGEQLVKHPSVKAVAFTGSYGGGKSLYDIAVRRPEPIPVYAEMSSVNPVFFFNDAITENAFGLAKGFAASLTQGSGQFCTNPGVIVLLKNKSSEDFLQLIKDELSAITVGAMLTKKIQEAYVKGIKKLCALPEGKPLLLPQNDDVIPFIIETTVKNVLATPGYLTEVFGPSAVAVYAESYEEMLLFCETLTGQLTTTFHVAGNDSLDAAPIIESATFKAGRLIINGFPTGVEVSTAMVHGGPFPATTDARTTSVGVTSIYRFTRPVCYQNFPNSLLPAAAIQTE